MPDRVVVSNTTPIIALALVQRLDLLHTLYGEVLIPPSVEAELQAGVPRPGAGQAATASYIRTVALLDPQRADLLSDLDRGEAEVIALALERHADLVIIDERMGRRHASRLGLPVTGVLGVLLKAKQLGYLAEVRPCIDQMRRRGIYLGAALVQRVLELAEEPW